MMGFDAEYMKRWDRKNIHDAKAEGRIILTRKRSEVREEGCIVIESDHLEEQIAFLDRILGISEKIQPFSRCSICNLPLKYVKAVDVKNQVPEYIYVTHEEFATCPGCLRIYWKGTHPFRSMQLFHSFIRASEDR